MTLRSITAAVAATFAAAVVATTAGAAVVVTDTTLRDAAFTVVAGDLLETSVTSVTATGNFNNEGVVGVSALRDGSFGAVGSPSEGNQNLGAATADDNNTLTYTFDRAYDLTSIATYAGWDAYRGGQSYTVAYATAAAPAVFTTLGSEYNNANGGGDVATRAVFTASSGLLAQAVTGLRFTFNGNLQYGFAGYREIDVSGRASDVAGAVPEPATWAMLIVGFGLIGVAARRRRTIAFA